MYKVTVGYVNGTEEIYYVDSFEWNNGVFEIHGVQWRDKPLATVGIIPSTAILAVWISPVGD